MPAIKDIYFPSTGDVFWKKNRKPTNNTIDKRVSQQSYVTCQSLSRDRLSHYTILTQNVFCVIDKFWMYFSNCYLWIRSDRRLFLWVCLKCECVKISNPKINSLFVSEKDTMAILLRSDGLCCPMNITYHSARIITDVNDTTAKNESIAQYIF